MTAALLDTSVFVALEAGRRIDAAALPDRSVISVVTSAELHAGVMIAEDDRVRELRLGTLGMAQVLELVPIDEVVARSWARLRRSLRERGRSMHVNDAWIAATAIAHDLLLVTQDRGFVDVPDLDVALV